ncbi:MAG TPA: hypothetical protein VJO99_25880, partial [Burkholderiaceae bacterium]|nr:hypothetical protein [Burkholderiaceae bacterium]
MSRAALTFQRGLERMAQAANKANVEFQTIKAATLGLGDSTLDLIQKVNGAGGAFATVGTKGADALGKITSAAAGATSQTSALLTTMVEKIRQINAQAEALKQEAVGQNQAKTLTDDGLKKRLADINAVRDATLKLAQEEYAKDSAELKAAAAADALAEKRRVDTERLIATVQKLNYTQDVADIEKLRATVEAENQAEQKAAQQALRQQAERTAAAQKIIDVQNGLTATYRTQLTTLKELRDAGALSPAQFKQAGAELVAKQPIVQQRSAEKAAAESAEKAAAAQALALAQVNSATATAAAQSQVYAAFLLAEAANAEQAAQAAAHLAEVEKAVSDARERSIAAQQAAYQTKTAYIAKVNEEAQALFRTKEAQRELDAIRVGVSPDQAAKLAKFSGDREFIAGIYRMIDAEQKFAAEFGKTATEILKQDAAERGLTNTTAGMIARFDALAVANQKTRDAAKQGQSNDAYIAALEREVAVLGKTRSEIVQLELAERGLTERGAALAKALRDTDERTGQFGKSAFAAKNQLLTLRYTISDIVSS